MDPWKEDLRPETGNLLTLEKELTVHSTAAWKRILKTAMQAWNKILHLRWDYESSSFATLWDEIRPETQFNYAWIPDPGGFKPLSLWFKVCSNGKQVHMKGSRDGSDNFCDFKVLMSMNCILLRLPATTEMWCDFFFLLWQCHRKCYCDYLLIFIMEGNTKY